MAVRRLQDSQILERELAKGTPLEEAMKIAGRRATVKPPLKRKRKAKKKAKTKKYKPMTMPTGHWGLTSLKRKKR